jgi:hypothetical protein
MRLGCPEGMRASLITDSVRCPACGAGGWRCTRSCMRLSFDMLLQTQVRVKGSIDISLEVTARVPTARLPPARCCRAFGRTENHETLLRTDQEARAKGRTGRDAHPCHEDRRKPVCGRRSRAFSQDGRHPQAPLGLIPTLMCIALTFDPCKPLKTLGSGRGSKLTLVSQSPQ